MHGTLIDLKPRDRYSECAKQWMQLSESEKDLWKKKCDAANQNYVQELEKYKQVSCFIESFLAKIIEILFK